MVNTRNNKRPISDIISDTSSTTTGTQTSESSNESQTNDSNESQPNNSEYEPPAKKPKQPVKKTPKKTPSKKSPKKSPKTPKKSPKTPKETKTSKKNIPPSPVIVPIKGAKKGSKKNDTLETMCEGCEDPNCKDCEDLYGDNEDDPDFNLNEFDKLDEYLDDLEYLDELDELDSQDIAYLNFIKDSEKNGKIVDEGFDEELDTMDFKDSLLKNFNIKNIEIHINCDMYNDEEPIDPEEISDLKKDIIKRTPTPFERITAKDFIIKKDRLTSDKITCLNDLILVLDHEDALEKQKELCISLKELNNLVGMNLLKEQIVNQILFFVQDLYEPGMFLHTVITGKPGCGKTSIAHIMSKIYKSLGFLSNDKVIVADRGDLVGMYLGHTAIKTKNVLKSAIGGILLIDEAYSLGSAEREDSFSKECIDTINQFLSEHAEDLICIIAGYKDSIEECFFKQNSGLKRRFPWSFEIDNYSPEDLYEIFKKQCGKWVLNVPKAVIIKGIKDNMEAFDSNGGSTQNLLDRCKICHARRIFFVTASKEISEKDFEEGLKDFVPSKKKEEKSEYLSGMYT